jgi:hypothetical protein
LLAYKIKAAGAKAAALSPAVAAPASVLRFFTSLVAELCRRRGSERLLDHP